MKIQYAILMVFMLLFLISSVSATDLNEMDYLQANDDVDLNEMDYLQANDDVDLNELDYLQANDISDLNEDISNLQDSCSNDIKNHLDSEDSSSISINSEEVSDDTLDNLDSSAIGYTQDSNSDDSFVNDIDDVPDFSENSILLKDAENDNNLLTDNPSKVTYALDLDDIINNENPLYAVIDFGSNSIHMEIYELKKSGKIKSMVSVSEPSVTAIYCEDNKLTPKGISELISIYKDFIDIMDLADVNTRFFFATASLRKIDNCNEVIATVKDELGVDINLISGEDEANLSFNSVKDDELTTDDGILIDLGGGSCEVIDFVDKNPVTMESMPIGVSSIYNEYVSGIFPNGTEVESIEARILEELNKLEISNATERTDLFGIGGSVKAIKKVLAYLNMIDEDAKSIPVSMLDDLLDVFKDGTKENYQILMNIEPDRLNTFVPGLIITKTICRYFGIETFHICKKGIREGIAQQLADKDLANLNPNMKVSDIVAYPNEDIQFPVSIEANATGIIVIELNDMIFYASADNGSAVFTLPKMNPGDYKVKVSYGGDDNYRYEKQKISLHVKSVSLEMYDMIRGYNSGMDYSVKLKDDEGNAVVDKLVLFTVGQIQYFARTNNEGVAVINPGLNVGAYSVTVASPLLDGSTTKTLKIVKRILNNRNINVYYNSNQKYKVKIIGEDGKAESNGKSVKVIIDNKQYTYKTDKDGFIIIALDKSLKPAKHTIKIQYKGSAVSNSINVKHALSSKKTFKVKKSAKKIILKAKLTLNNKKLIKGKTIKFKIKGKIHKAKTNSKGIAKIALKKSKFKKGSYSIKIIYLKDMINAKVNVL